MPPRGGERRDERTAQALAAAGNALAGGTWMWSRRTARCCSRGAAARGAAPRSGWGLPHLFQAAAFAARRPGHVVLLADRDDAAVIAQLRRPASRRAVRSPGRAARYPSGPAGRAAPRGAARDGSEPESGGEANTASIARASPRPRPAWRAHRPRRGTSTYSTPSRPPARSAPRGTTIAAARCPRQRRPAQRPDRAALDGITGEAMARREARCLLRRGRGLTASMPSPSNWPNSRSLCCSWRPTSHGTVTAELPDRRHPTEFIVGDFDTGAEVPLEDGWSGPRCTRTRSSCGCGPLRTAGRPARRRLPAADRPTP